MVVLRFGLKNIPTWIQYQILEKFFSAKISREWDGCLAIKAEKYSHSLDFR